MENPFKQLIESSDPPKERVNEQVMENIHFNGFLFKLIEMFTALFGFVLTASAPEEDDTESV